MQRRIGLSMLLVGFWLGCCGSIADAAKNVDPTGTWKWETEAGGSSIANKLTLVFKDDKLTGTYEGYGMELKLEDGKVKGKEISFQLTAKRDGKEALLEFQGKLSRDRIKGTIEIDFGEPKTYDWVATRSVELEDVVGRWDIELSTEGGEAISATLKLKNNNGKLSGTLKSRYGKAKLKKIRLRRGVMSFVVEYEEDDRKLTVVFKGKPRGNSMTGKVEYKQGDDSGFGEFTAKRAAEKPAEKTGDKKETAQKES